MCEEMTVEAVPREESKRYKKKHFAFEAPEEPTADAMTRRERAFSNMVIDISAIESSEEKLDSLHSV